MTAIAPHNSLAATIQAEVDDAISRVLDQTLTARARRVLPFAPLTPLRWAAMVNHLGLVECVVGTVVANTTAATTARVLATWAEALELAESEVAEPGTKHYVGTVDDQPLRIWGVVDPARFDRAAADRDQAIEDVLADLDPTEGSPSPDADEARQAATVAAFEHNGRTYEIDHLGDADHDDMYGEYTIYCNGEQIVDFASHAAGYLPEERHPLPDTEELIELAKAALPYAQDHDR